MEVVKFSYEHLNDVFQIEKECIETPWGLTALEEELKRDDACYFVVKHKNEIAGYGGMRVSLDFCDITNIAVKPKFRQQGIGTLILNSLIEKANELNINEIALEVNEKNIGAIALYEKCGFLKVGIRKKYYKNNDGILMIRKDK